MSSLQCFTRPLGLVVPSMAAVSPQRQLQGFRTETRKHMEVAALAMDMTGYNTWKMMTNANDDSTGEYWRPMSFRVLLFPQAWHCCVP